MNSLVDGLNDENGAKEIDTVQLIVSDYVIDREPLPLTGIIRAFSTVKA